MTTSLRARSLTPLIALALALGATACATGPAYTPFQAATTGKFGFSEQRIEANRFRVMFEGNGRTSRQRVEDSLLLRAANVTLENGYDWFQIVSRATDPKTIQVRSPYMGSSWGGGFGYYGGFATYRSWSPRYGWVASRHPAYGYPFYSPFDGFDAFQEVTRFEASAEIILGKGQKPKDQADAFDARDVSTNLTPRLNPPPVAGK
jgi:hypothetical protein